MYLTHSKNSYFTQLEPFHISLTRVYFKSESKVFWNNCESLPSLRKPSKQSKTPYPRWDLTHERCPTFNAIFDSSSPLFLGRNIRIFQDFSKLLANCIFHINHTSQQGALFWLEAEILSRIAKPNQAKFPTKIFLKIGGIDLGSPRMLARRSTSELSVLDTLKCNINIK